MRTLITQLLLVLLFSGQAAAHSLAELHMVNLLPEPSPGQGCPVPPIPQGPQFVEGEGYSLDRLVAWRNFNLNGMRYYIEYEVLKRKDDGEVTTRPFPSLYMVDLNRDGHFDVPGEAFNDVAGNGRCADLRPVHAPDEKPA